MGEDLTPFWAEFNGSLRIESRAERLTSEAGAVILREVVERLGVGPWMVERLHDSRDPRLITHPLAELLHTAVLLIAQGWGPSPGVPPFGRCGPRGGPSRGVPSV